MKRDLALFFNRSASHGSEGQNMTSSIDLSAHGLGLPRGAERLARRALRFRTGRRRRAHLDRRAGRHLGCLHRPLPEGQAHRRRAGVERRHLVGQRQHQAQPQLVRPLPSARPTIWPSKPACTWSTATPAGTRGSGSRCASICARPYHALFMHNMLIRPTRAAAGDVRRARLRDLQRRRVPGRSAYPGI